ncbi:sterol-sensing domain of SREBP cleavage-activation-domain-containing protein, partial [Stachybotrys elegans]
MIWYLLYPLRGTTEAPCLAPSNPIRSALTRYGRYAARHAVTILLISVAIATSLIYPIPFLFTTDFTNGASNLPHHVWTVAQPLPYDTKVEPDVIMRSIWVHGSYMKALDADLLSSALDLQDQLLGPTENFDPNRPHPTTSQEEPSVTLSPGERDSVHVINGLTNQSWFFHSPLLYWKCSRQRILDDDDIVSTVNDRKNQSTSVNVTLRHSIVFSGKRFEDRRLLAADALVITLLHLRDSPVGAQWEKRAAELPSTVGDKWDIYPADGHISASQLYEFQFRPMSWQDSVILALAYCCTIVYFLLTLSKLRAFKSKIGLMVTVVTQVALAIMSSFTICAVFNIDLSRMPRAAYPLAILCTSLENIFRLINAVILTPPEDNTSTRIGQAVGQTAYVAIVSIIQNVIILLGLRRVVSPGVGAFCIFAAVAIVFDFFLLSTFFLAVLSVDVRRTELSDALAKESMRQNRGVSHSRARATWFDGVVSGKAAMSTRIAGTIVMIGFVLIAQWHFFDVRVFLRSLFAFNGNAELAHASTSKISLLDHVHQARSPTSWLRLQDHETAHEVINIIKPSSFSYVARVYEPLVFVLKDSDRMPHAREPSLLPAAYDFVHHQLVQFCVIIVVLVAGLRLLTSYLLWEDEANTDDEHESGDNSSLVVKSLTGGHTLDVAMLATSTRGHVVSAGLDRLVCVWNVLTGEKPYLLSATGEGANLFPVLAMTIDERSRWLALLTPYRVVFWNLTDCSWGTAVAVNTGGQRPEAFFFLPSKGPGIPRLVLVRRNGTLAEVGADGHAVQDFAICRYPLVSAQQLIIKGHGSSPGHIKIVTVSRKGCVHVASLEGASWVSHKVLLEDSACQGIHQVVPLPGLRAFLLAASDRVYLVSGDDREAIHTFVTEEMQPRSLQCVYFRHHASYPDLVGLTSFTLCYATSNPDACVIQAYSPPEEKSAIGLGPVAPASDSEWCLWSNATEAMKRVANPGVWNLLSDGSVVGTRRTVQAGQETHATGHEISTKLRRRHQSADRGQELFGCWQVWTATLTARYEADEVRPLFQEDDQSGHLVTFELGPRARIGKVSVAFGFGNVIKLITVGHERLECDEDGANGDMPKAGSRRRRP